MSTIQVNLMADSQGGSVAPISSVMRNRIINGAMVLSQRNGTSAVTIDGGASYTLDRYLCQDNTDGAYTVAQSSVAPAGFTNSLLVTITGTDTSLTTTQFGRIVQRIEGFNTADLGWGTASASTITLSFTVRSSVTGTFSGSLVNNDSNRIYAFTYTINAANTFEYKTETIVGDTAGTWATNNSTGIELNLSIGAGPDRTVAAGAWGTSLAFAATGQTNLFATSGATFFITGVQLEKGTQATGFEYRQIGTELQLCQRYYQRATSETVFATMITGVICNGASSGNGAFQLMSPMRSTPTLDSSAASTFAYSDGSTATACTSISLASSQSNTRMVALNFVTTSGLTQFRPYRIEANNTASAFLGFSAEL